MNNRHRPAKAPRLKEIDIQRACAGFMRLDGWHPLQTDPCRDRSRAKGFGEVGMADHLFLRTPQTVFPRAIELGRPFPRLSYRAAADGQILWVEFKRPGASAAIHQLEWHFGKRIAGFLTVIGGIDFEPTYDGFVSWYRLSGLLRREGL